jgi:hypothetical protein
MECAVVLILAVAVSHFFHSQRKANMRNNVIITVISSAVTVGGVYFFHIGVLGSLVIYNLGLAAGVTHATLPLMSLHAKRDNS